MVPPTTPEPLYTIRQVVDKGFIPYHPDTVRQWCREGKIRTDRGGTRTAKYLIPESAITEWRARNTYTPEAA